MIETEQVPAESSRSGTLRCGNGDGHKTAPRTIQLNQKQKAN